MAMGGEGVRCQYHTVLLFQLPPPPSENFSSSAALRKGLTLLLPPEPGQSSPLSPSWVALETQTLWVP